MNQPFSGSPQFKPQDNRAYSGKKAPGLTKRNSNNSNSQFQQQQFGNQQNSFGA